MIDDNINHEYIIRYIRDLIVQRDTIVSDMERFAAQNDIPISQPETIVLIELLIKLCNAENVLEIGTAIGYSAIIMSRCGARVITIEGMPEMADIAKRNISRAELSDKITVLCGDARDLLEILSLISETTARGECSSIGFIGGVTADNAASLSKITDMGELMFDVIFLDAAKGQYMEFFPYCMGMLKKGGLLISDNVLYKGMTATDELVMRRKITIVKRLRAYLEMLTKHDALDTVILPVGDGVALSRKR